MVNGESIVKLRSEIRDKWLDAWGNYSFRIKLFSGVILNMLLLLLLSFFLNNIEKRQGIQLHDTVLQILPAYDVSSVLIVFTWGTLLLWVLKSFIYPNVLLTFIFSYLFLTVFRIATIYTVPLNPPSSLITLADPLSNLLYSGKFKTKDLFFSGHVSASFLIGLCMQKKRERVFVYLSSFIIGLCVLVQHVHYTIDVLAAPVFACLSFYGGKKIILAGTAN